MDLSGVATMSQVLWSMLPPFLCIPLKSDCTLSRSSPHLVQVRERIRINGQPIGKELFTKYFWQVYGRLEKTKVGDLEQVNVTSVVR